MPSQAEQLKERTKRFAIEIVKAYQSLPRTGEASVLGKQLLRAGTSVAANYRAVCRSRSKAEFAARMGVVVEEADEAVFWLELLAECHVVQSTADLLSEANELLAIFAASHRTVKFVNGSMNK